MNPNLFIWTSDWHLVSNDTEQGIAGDPTRPTNAWSVAAHLAMLQPTGVIDTGDCKDHYGADSADELDRYLEKVKSVLPEIRTLPGNHDELNDYTSPGSDFSLYDAKLGGPPYHWVFDWDAPQVRFIGYHARIVHVNDVHLHPGFFAVEPSERQWLADELGALPEGWQAIVCSHPPVNPYFGNNIGHWTWLQHGGTEVRAILAAHSSRITAYLSGHRHGNMETHVLDDILHINGPGMSYTIGNGLGAWVPITYNPALRTLTFDLRLGPPSGYHRKAGYTPIEVQLPPIPIPPTNVDLAIEELKRTTVGYINKYWTVPPAGSHWDNALDLLEGTVGT